MVIYHLADFILRDFARLLMRFRLPAGFLGPHPSKLAKNLGFLDIIIASWFDSHLVHNSASNLYPLVVFLRIIFGLDFCEEASETEDTDPESSSP